MLEEIDQDPYFVAGRSRRRKNGGLFVHIRKQTEKMRIKRVEVGGALRGKGLCPFRHQSITLIWILINGRTLLFL